MFDINCKLSLRMHHFALKKVQLYPYSSLDLGFLSILLDLVHFFNAIDIIFVKAVLLTIYNLAGGINQ